MPKIAKELTQLEINRLKPKHAKNPTKYAVGGVSGLHIQITPTNARSWLLIASYMGKRPEIGLGPYPEVTLKAARDTAREMKQQIKAGQDPLKLRRDAWQAGYLANLFEKTLLDAFEEFLPIKREQLKSEKYRRSWGEGLKTYVLPTLGSKTVSEITTAEVADTLLPIWNTKNATAEKLKQQLKDIFDYSIAKGYRKNGNPVSRDSNIKHILKTVPKTSHYPSPKLSDIHQWWSDLRQQKYNGALALQFQALTATRTGAVRCSTLDEFDFVDKIWTIQPTRQSSKIKAGEEPRRVPLTDAMIEIIDRVERCDGSLIVFPAPRGGFMSDAALVAVMKRIHAARIKIDGKGYIDPESGRPAVPHGLRTTFKAWSNEVSDYDDILSEIALWHNVGSRVRQIYARTDGVNKRRAMMDDWGEFINS